MSGQVLGEQIPSPERSFILILQLSAPAMIWKMVGNAFLEDCGEWRGEGGAFGGLCSSHFLPVRAAPQKNEAGCGTLSGSRGSYLCQFAWNSHRAVGVPASPREP